MNTNIQILNETATKFAQALPGYSGAEFITLEDAVDAAHGFHEDAIYGFTPNGEGWIAVKINFEGKLLESFASYASLEEAESDEHAFN